MALPDRVEKIMDLSTEQNPLGIRAMLVDDHLVMRIRKRMAELDREAT